MSESILRIYQSPHVNKKANYYYDTPSLHLGSPIYENFNFQYQRLYREMTIKISVSQVNQPVYANYLSITQDNRTYYFFINRAEWAGAETIRLDIEMDVINTFRLTTDYSFDPSTHIRRQHKDRWVRGTNKLLPVIDRYAENINPPLKTYTKNEILDTCQWQFARYGMIVAFAGTEEAHTGNVAAYIFGEGGNLRSEYYTNGDGNYTMPVPRPGKNECLTSPSTYLVIDSPYKVYDADSNGEPLPITGLPQTIFSKVIYKGPDVHDSYTPDPYLAAINADGDWNNNKNYLVSYLNDQTFSMTNFYNTQLSEVSANITRSIPVYHTYRSIDYESKLMNSEFSFHRFSYAADTYDIEYELITNITECVDVNDVKLKPTFFLASDLTGDMGFIFDIYGDAGNVVPSYDNESDNSPLRMLINRDNSKTIMSYAFTEYQNVDSQYAKKELTLSRIATGVSVAGSLASAGLGVIGGIATSNPAMAATSMFGATTSIAGSVLGRIQSEVAYEHNIEKKKTSAIAVSGTSGIDTFNICETAGNPFRAVTGGHRGAKLRWCVGGPRKEIRENIYDYLYRYGYADDSYGIPNVATRSRFNYIECEAVLRSANVPVQFIDALENKYREGITFIHDDMDWNYEYENWETSLFSQE
jgi:hypothetical protein